MIVTEKVMEGYKIQVSQEQGEMTVIPNVVADEPQQELPMERPKEKEKFWRWLKNGITWTKNK